MIHLAAESPRREPPSAAAADHLRRSIDDLEPGAQGAEMHAVIRELYPIGRSITGDGLRRSLRVTATSTPGRTESMSSPEFRTAWPA